MVNMTAWANDLIKGPHRVAIPIMTHPGIEMINEKIINALQNGEIHALAIEKLNEVYPVAAKTVIMDLTLEAEAFGCNIEFQEDEMPHILGRLVTNAQEIEALRVPEITEGRVPHYILANKLTVESTTGKPVFAGVIGPFSLAGRLFDVSEIMMACYIEPDVIHLLLNKCTMFIINYCKALKNAGCAGVLVAEPAAGLLSNDDCLMFSSEYVKMIVDAVQDEYFTVILHNCGNSGHCNQATLYTGANAYHFGNAIDMVETLDYFPKDKLILGNVDPVGILKQSTPNEIKYYVTNLLKKTANYKNFILSTGCDLPPHVPAINIEAFFEALTEYNSKS